MLLVSFQASYIHAHIEVTYCGLQFRFLVSFNTVESGDQLTQTAYSPEIKTCMISELNH